MSGFSTDAYGDAIRLAGDDDVRDWCTRLGCSEDELREAVNAVGANAAWVAEYLAKRRRAPDFPGM